MNKSPIKILIDFVRLTNFIFIFHVVFFSFANWRFVFSKIRRGPCRVPLSRTFVFGLRTKTFFKT